MPDDGIFIPIFLNSWFSRIWTLQELINASDAEVVCGKQHLPWEIFATWACLYISNHAHNTSTLEEVITQNGNTPDAIIAFLIRRQAKKSMETPFLNGVLQTVISTIHYNKATDSRDLMFALYPLFRSLELDDVPAIDYAQSPEATYQGFTKFLLRHTAIEVVLYHNAGGNKSLKTPSWVPDWASPRGQLVYYDALIQTALIDRENMPFPIVGSYEFRGERLTVQGIVLDSVYETSQCESAGFTRSAEANVFRLRSFLRVLPRTLAGLGEALLLEFLDLITLEPDPPEFDRNTALEYLKVCTELKEGSDDIPSGMRQRLRDIGTSPGLDRLFSFLGWYQCFSTQKSFGLASGFVKRGDKIATLSSCPLPVVLRPSGENFEFVGLAKVSNLSDKKTMVSTLESAKLDTIVLI